MGLLFTHFWLATTIVCLFMMVDSDFGGVIFVGFYLVWWFSFVVFILVFVLGGFCFV